MISKIKQFPKWLSQSYTFPSEHICAHSHRIWFCITEFQATLYSRQKMISTYIFSGLIYCRPHWSNLNRGSLWCYEENRWIFLFLFQSILNLAPDRSMNRQTETGLAFQVDLASFQMVVGTKSRSRENKHEVPHALCEYHCLPSSGSH